MNTTPKWLKRLRKRKRQEAKVAIAAMQWAVEEQKRMIEQQFAPKPRSTGDYWGVV